MPCIVTVRAFQILAALVGALTFTACLDNKPSLGPAAPKKILLISIDTTRADHLSAYGYERATTPFIDSLAKIGIRMTNAYSVMPTTDPSHTSMLTCQYPRSHGVMANTLRRKNRDGPSLGLWLGEFGYEVAAITARLGLDPTRIGIGGFDSTDAPKLPVRHRDADEIIKLVSHWLSARDSKPWFLWAHLWEPHKPYDPDGELRTAFTSNGLPSKKIFEDPNRFLAEGETLPEPIVAGATALYDSEILEADIAVKTMVDQARAADPPGEPLVIIVSDHGESLADRQAATRIGFGHGALIYDEVVKVPWIFSWGDQLPAGELETAVSLVDLAPTILDLVEAEAFRDAASREDCDGRSVASSLRARTEPAPQPIVLDRRLFKSHPIPDLRWSESAWIEYPYKLIVNDGEKNVELYQLDVDPGETKNLAASKPELARQLSAELEKWKSVRPLARDKTPMSRERAAELEALRSLGYID